jgi:3-deoxy-D-arabino-heptulosonate 7-phosphate (DAHP) synthase
MTDRLEQINPTIQPLSSWMKASPLPWVIAGPCSAETERQVLDTARLVSKSDHVVAYRAGVWKPRTNPYSFQGDTKSLDILLEGARRTGLPVDTEVMDETHVQLALAAGVACLQVGARNALNYSLLRAIGRAVAERDTSVLAYLQPNGPQECSGSHASSIANVLPCRRGREAVC